MFGKLLDKATLLKAKITKDELEQALIAATTDDNWQASTTVLHEIASSAFAHDKWQRIRDFLWDKLKNTKGWKKLLKALHIVEFLLKNGPASTSSHFRYEMGYFRTLLTYQLQEDGVDRGASVRERAKVIVGLLENEELLEDERVRAKQIRERMSHLAGTTSYNSEGATMKTNIPKYESFNSKSFETAKEDNNYYNYGSGNYGDREDDHHHRVDYFENASRFSNDNRSRKPPQNEPPQKEKSPQRYVTVAKPPPIAQETNDNKQKYETMAQRLMKNNSKPNATKTEQVQPIKPDLSYKKKDVEDLLIDTEASFVENRYHFAPPPQTYYQPEPPKQTYTPPPVVEVSPPIVQVQSTPPSINLLSQLQGLNFLGVPSAPATATTATPTQPTQQYNPPTQSYNPPTVSQVVPAATASKIASPIIIPTIVTQSQTPPQQAANLYSIYNSPTPPPYTQPYNVSSYYNSPPNYTPYPPQPYYNQPINYPPQYAPTPYPNNYPQSNYYQPNPYQASTNYYAPPAYQRPYSSPSNLPSSLLESPSKQQQPQQQQPPKQAEDEFGTFKNGGSFDIDKINWMSKKQKNLTDLTDLTIIKPKIVQKSKDQFSNNIVIDKWAW